LPDFNRYVRCTIESAEFGPAMFLFLTVVQAIVAAMLVGIILMQKSEGGGLGVGGSPSGMMSARGAADLLTRTTTFLAILFVALSITLAVLAASEGKPETIDQSLQPATSAAHTFSVTWFMGQFHGVIRAVTPIGSCRM